MSTPGSFILEPAADKTQLLAEVTQRFVEFYRALPKGSPNAMLAVCWKQLRQDFEPEDQWAVFEVMTDQIMVAFCRTHDLADAYIESLDLFSEA